MRRLVKAWPVNAIELEVVRKTGGRNAAQRGKNVAHSAAAKEESAVMATPF